MVESKTPKVWMDEVMGLNINGMNKSINKKELTKSWGCEDPLIWLFLKIILPDYLYSKSNG